MDRVPVSSSNLASIGYEPDTETLEVEFKSSGIYQYFNVPQFMYDRLMESASVGKFFSMEIKEAYSCTKI